MRVYFGSDKRWLAVRVGRHQLIVKRTTDEYFSERNGLTPVARLLGLTFVWQEIKP